MTGVVCFIDWVKDYRIQVEGSTEANWHEQEDLYTTLTGPAFAPGPAAQSAFNVSMGFECPEGCCNIYGWYMCAIYAVRTQYALQDFNEWKRASNWKIEGDSIKWAFVSMNTTLEPRALPLAELTPVYNDWEAFVETNKGPLDGVWQTCPLWGWMVTQREILTAVFQSIGACLALAWLILSIATTNWIISSIALTCILVVLFLCGGAITMAGWALGIFEAIGLIIVVGLAVDYSVHICHSYNETRFIDGVAATRFQKTQHALTEMGVSVVSGAATTFLASLFLIPAMFAFYYVFGMFMLITVIFSLLVSLTMLPALLCILGPESDRGDLAFLRGMMSKIGEKLRCRKASKNQQSEQVTM
jgi:predicted RND superfamily exporter protein